MHAFARRLHGTASDAPAPQTKGLVLSGGWRYDLMERLVDLLVFRGQVRTLRQRTLDLACVQLGEQVLDVGCGTGTLALSVQQCVGNEGQVVGIDPSVQQIARARARATRRHAPTEFRVGVIEQLPCADQSFDVVLSTLMMHHVGVGLKRQGLAEIARVLRPGGRLVIADFTRKQDRQGAAARFHAGGSAMDELVALITAAGYVEVAAEAMRPRRFSAFPGAGIVTAKKG
jgi:ubiquinone/menaquinone biosynthesis C-methylase UbiE